MNGLPDMTGGGGQDITSSPLRSLADKVCKPALQARGKRQHGMTEDQPQQLDGTAPGVQPPAARVKDGGCKCDAGEGADGGVRVFSVADGTPGGGGLASTRLKRQRRQEQPDALQAATDAAIAAGFDQDMLDDDLKASPACDDIFRQLGDKPWHQNGAAGKLQHLACCAALRGALDDVADVDLPSSPVAAGQQQHQDMFSFPDLSPGEAAADADIPCGLAEQQRQDGHTISSIVGAGAGKGSSNNSSSSWLGDVNLPGMSEEEQLKMAIQESMKSAGSAMAGLGLGAAAAAVPAADGGDYNYEAALQAALAASVAEHQQDGQVTDCTAKAAGAPLEPPEAAAGIDGDAAGDNMCIVTNEVATGPAADISSAQQRRRQRPRGPVESAAAYQLHAVVRHKGPLASSGHFVSDVLNSQVSKDGQSCQWFHYDDSHVQPISQAAVMSSCKSDGYLFFYVNTAITRTQKQQLAGKQLADSEKV
eukprot:gene5407-5640_t